LPLALLGSCLHHLLRDFGGAPVSGPEVVRVKLKPQDQAASAGPRPSPEAARVIAALCLEETLKDYDSAKIQWGSDVRLATWDEYDRERAKETQRAAYREVAGWEFFANVNAKNGRNIRDGKESEINSGTDYQEPVPPERQKGTVSATILCIV
jgi:hypothetical protein